MSKTSPKFISPDEEIRMKAFVRQVLESHYQIYSQMIEYNGLYQDSFLELVHALKKINTWLEVFDHDPDMTAILRKYEQKAKAFLEQDKNWTHVTFGELCQISNRIFELSLLTVDYCDADKALADLLSFHPTLDSTSTKIEDVNCQDLIQEITWGRHKIISSCNLESKIDQQLLLLYPIRQTPNFSQLQNN
jgi:hypothetical protein